jgi:hypothetical protein
MGPGGGHRAAENPDSHLTALMLLVLAPDKAQAIPTDATEKSIQGLVGDGSGP